jgi:ubiquinone/menaquinone biosynthesis C-methylase UbiE
MLGDIIGADGHAVGFDVSPAQLDQARQRLTSGATNLSFVEASAIATGCAEASFDLVYCRFLLLHLPEPHRALQEMMRLLKPEGILVCEDGDLTSAGSEPPSALDAFADLFGKLSPMRGVDYTLGRRLY